jgi:hypothetical protein
MSVSSEVVDRAGFIGMSASAQKDYFAEHGFLLVPAVLDADSVRTPAPARAGPPLALALT